MAESVLVLTFWLKVLFCNSIERPRGVSAGGSESPEERSVRITVIPGKETGAGIVQGTLPQRRLY